MTSTCQNVINRALGKIGIVAAGENPATADNALALRQLRALYRKLRTSGAFGVVYEVIPTEATYRAQENEHIMRRDASVVTITLPETIDNLEAVNDYGNLTYMADENAIRPPRDCSIIIITDLLSTDQTVATDEFIYDGQTKRWRSVNLLNFNEIAPLSHRDENGLASLLAMQLAPEFGQTVPDLVVRDAYHFEEGITHNWSQAGELIIRQDYF